MQLQHFVAVADTVLGAIRAGLLTLIQLKSLNAAAYQLSLMFTGRSRSCFGGWMPVHFRWGYRVENDSIRKAKNDGLW
jgi:hypothetical protein